MATLVSPYGNILNPLVKQLRSRVWQQLWELTSLCPYTPLKTKLPKYSIFFSAFPSMLLWEGGPTLHKMKGPLFVPFSG